MNPFAIAAIVLVCALGAGICGTILYARLPDSHRDQNSREVMNNILTLLGSVSALVLSLLVASASATHDRQNSELRLLSANVMLLDRTLGMYGPEAKSIRDGLRDSVQRAHDRIWSRGGVRPEAMNSAATRSAADANFARIQDLSPKTEAERTLKSLASQEAEITSGERLLMFEQLGAATPWPLLAVLLFWFSMLFLGIGLQSPLNGTVAGALLVGALSVAAAIFLILELGDPYRGVMRISDQPLLNAIAQIDH